MRACIVIPKGKKERDTVSIARTGQGESKHPLGPPPSPEFRIKESLEREDGVGNLVLRTKVK